MPFNCFEAADADNLLDRMISSRAHPRRSVPPACSQAPFVLSALIASASEPAFTYAKVIHHGSSPFLFAEQIKDRSVVDRAMGRV